MKNKFTQVVSILVILLLCLLKAFTSQGQNHKVFEMAYSKSDTYEINKTYSKSTTIYPFEQNKAIFSLAITANVQLNNYKSFVRGQMDSIFQKEMESRHLIPYAISNQSKVILV